MSSALASDEEIRELVEAIQGEQEGARLRLDELLDRYGADSRLHFMKGSLLAGAGRSIEAHRSMSRAVELAPGYSLARYQLGFFELTSGQPEKALSTWGPLLAEGEDSYLRKFVEGMTHLIRDEFSSAITSFEQGLALNRDNEPLNEDIRMLIAQCRKLEHQGQAGEPAEHSATSLLLSPFGSKSVQ